jgi:GNAT superfamily N-acetyltransferase
MKNAASIRLARTSDAGEVARLTSQLGYEVTESAVATTLSHILERDDQQFWIAESDGCSVGWIHALFSEYVDGEAFVAVGGLVVDRHHRRSSIGQQLMGQAETWAKARGCSLVRLSSSATRTAAHQFYERLGYTNVKTAYSFVKSLDGRQINFAKFVPKVDQ